MEVPPSSLAAVISEVIRRPITIRRATEANKKWFLATIFCFILFLFVWGRAAVGKQNI